MGYSNVQIVNMALAAFGSSAIQTFDDATPAGAAVALLYPLIIRGLFSEYPWNFARQTVQLNQLNLPELDDNLLAPGWQYGFALPANIIGDPLRILANSRWPDGPQTGFEIQGTTVFTNQIAIWCLGTFYVDEASWPDHFTRAAVACLAAELCMPISGNAQILQRLEVKAWGTPEERRLGGLLGLARNTDARSQPSRILLQNPLTDVRVSTISIEPTGLSLP